MMMFVAKHKITGEYLAYSYGSGDNTYDAKYVLFKPGDTTSKANITVIVGDGTIENHCKHSWEQFKFLGLSAKEFDQYLLLEVPIDDAEYDLALYTVCIDDNRFTYFSFEDDAYLTNFAINNEVLEDDFFDMFLTDSKDRAIQLKQEMVLSEFWINREQNVHIKKFALIEYEA